MHAVRYCSLGQITQAMFEVGGQYRDVAMNSLSHEWDDSRDGGGRAKSGIRAESAGIGHVQDPAVLKRRSAVDSNSQSHAPDVERGPR